MDCFSGFRFHGWIDPVTRTVFPPAGTAGDSDCIIFCDTTSGSGSNNVTITLPSAAASKGRIYFLKHIGPGSSMIVAPYNTDNIEGANANFTVGGTLTHAMFACDGTSWWRIA
jgi:hypothetical protein